MAVSTGKPVMKIVDPRINYNLMPWEKLMTCPYNASHAILEKKYLKHVNHCHRLHCKDQQAKGLKPLFSICRFDRAHHVKNEDLEAHERECEKTRKKDDWDDCEDSDGASAIPEEPRKHPEIDVESWKAICEEEWEVDPNAPKFVSDYYARAKLGQGVYAGVRLTKSEKKEFYAKENAAMVELTDAFGSNLFIARVKLEDTSSGGRQQSPVSQPNGHADSF